MVVWRFDRFARSVSHLLRALETFQALGIEFVSLSEQLDTSTPTGKMVFTVLGAVAELERSLIVERVKAGLRNARAKGKRLGRPPVTVNAATVARLRAEGVPWRRDSGQARGWRRNSISRGSGAFQISGKGFWSAIGLEVVLPCQRTDHLLDPRSPGALGMRTRRASR